MEAEEQAPADSSADVEEKPKEEIDETPAAPTTEAAPATETSDETTNGLSQEQTNEPTNGDTTEEQTEDGLSEAMTSITPDPGTTEGVTAPTEAMEVDPSQEQTEPEEKEAEEPKAAKEEKDEPENIPAMPKEQGSCFNLGVPGLRFSSNNVKTANDGTKMVQIHQSQITPDQLLALQSNPNIKVVFRHIPSGRSFTKPPKHLLPPGQRSPSRKRKANFQSSLLADSGDGDVYSFDEGDDFGEGPLKMQKLGDMRAKYHYGNPNRKKGRPRSIPDAASFAASFSKISKQQAKPAKVILTDLLARLNNPMAEFEVKLHTSQINAEVLANMDLNPQFRIMLTSKREPLLVEDDQEGTSAMKEEEKVEEEVEKEPYEIEEVSVAEMKRLEQEELEEAEKKEKEREAKEAERLRKIKDEEEEELMKTVLKAQVSRSGRIRKPSRYSLDIARLTKRKSVGVSGDSSENESEEKSKTPSSSKKSEKRVEKEPTPPPREPSPPGDKSTKSKSKIATPLSTRKTRRDPTPPPEDPKPRKRGRPRKYYPDEKTSKESEKSEESEKEKSDKDKEEKEEDKKETKEEEDKKETKEGEGEDNEKKEEKEDTESTEPEKVVTSTEKESVEKTEKDETTESKETQESTEKEKSDDITKAEPDTSTDAGKTATTVEKEKDEESEPMDVNEPFSLKIDDDEEKETIDNKFRLRKLLEQCSTDEIRTVFLPEAFDAINIGDLMLYKAGQMHGKDKKVNFPHLYKQFEDLHRSLAKEATRYNTLVHRANKVGGDKRMEKVVLMPVYHPKAAEALDISTTSIDAHICGVQKPMTTQVIAANSFYIKSKMESPTVRLSLPEATSRILTTPKSRSKPRKPTYLTNHRTYTEPDSTTPDQPRSYNKGNYKGHNISSMKYTSLPINKNAWSDNASKIQVRKPTYLEQMRNNSSTSITGQNHYIAIPSQDNSSTILQAIPIESSSSAIKTDGGAIQVATTNSAIAQLQAAIDQQSVVSTTNGAVSTVGPAPGQILVADGNTLVTNAAQLVTDQLSVANGSTLVTTGTQLVTVAGTQSASEVASGNTVTTTAAAETTTQAEQFFVTEASGAVGGEGEVRKHLVPIGDGQYVELPEGYSLIQTDEGYIIGQPGSTFTQGEDGNVYVTNSDGTTAEITQQDVAEAGEEGGVNVLDPIAQG